MRCCGLRIPFLLFVVASICAVQPLFGQQKAETIALFPIAPLAPNSNTPTGIDAAAAGSGNNLTQYSSLLSESVSIALRNAGFRVEEAAKSVDLDHVWTESRKMGAQFAVFGTSTLADGRLVVQLSAYDVRSRQLVAGALANGRADLSLYNGIDKVAAELVTRMQAWLENNPEGVTGPKHVERLVFESPDNGARIYLPTGKLLGVIKDGRLVANNVQLLVGSNLIIEKKKSGFISQWQTVRVRKVNETIHLGGLYPVTHVALIFDWMTGFAQGGGLSLRLYLLPNWIYWAYHGYMSVQPPTTSGGRTLTHMDNNVEIGSYVLQGPTKLIRLSLSFGIGVIDTILIGSDMGRFSDYYISFLNPTIDVNFRRFFLFARINMRFVLQSADSILPTGVMGTPNLPPFSAGLGFKW